MNPARLAAARALVSIRRANSYANLALDGVLKKTPLSERDRALFTSLVYGVIEREITLEHYLGLFCHRKRGALSPFLRATLHLALYELCFLSTPERAVLYEYCELAKSAEHKSGAGLVSAVLHAFLRARQANVDLYRTLPPIERRGVIHSLPCWMLSLWDRAYSEEVSEAIAGSFSRPRGVTIHVNTLKTTRDALLARFHERGLHATALDWHEALILLDAGQGDVRAMPGFESGEFFVQDAACVRAVCALDCQPGDAVADVCAAPGGKSFAAAIAMKSEGSILACDLHENRLHLIESAARRLGLSIIQTEASDARLPRAERYGTFDRVLCDVPCSGLGVIAKKPDLRRKRAEEIATLPSIQLDILLASAGLVKRGGRLMYSTCTLNPAENEEVVRAFLAQQTDFSLCGEMTTLFPQDGPHDGFFYAIMEKDRL